MALELPKFPERKDKTEGARNALRRSGEFVNRDIPDRYDFSITKSKNYDSIFTSEQLPKLINP
jgi:hypothetical protein